MKSIKEKALDYADEHGFRVPYDGSNNYYDKTDVKASKEGFEAGANYVLGEIEKMLSKANKYKDGSDHTILYLDIEFLVEQLKK